MEANKGIVKYEVTSEDIAMLKETLEEQEIRLESVRKKLKTNPLLFIIVGLLFMFLNNKFEFEYSSTIFGSLGAISMIIILIRDKKLLETRRFERIMLNYCTHIYQDAKNSFYNCSTTTDGFPPDIVLKEGLDENRF